MDRLATGPTQIRHIAYVCRAPPDNRHQHPPSFRLDPCLSVRNVPIDPASTVAPVKVNFEIQRLLLGRLLGLKLDKVPASKEEENTRSYAADPRNIFSPPPSVALCLLLASELVCSGLRQKREANDIVCLAAPPQNDSRERQTIATPDTRMGL